MDRRYLAATLAIVATFAVFSRGLRNGELKTLVCRGYSTMMQRFGGSSGMIGKVGVHLRPSQPPNDPISRTIVCIGGGSGGGGFRVTVAYTACHSSSSRAMSQGRSGHSRPDIITCITRQATIMHNAR